MSERKIFIMAGPEKIQSTYCHDEYYIKIEIG